MNFNLHTHTYLCHHATGTPEEYVEEAIKRGIKQLGFSEHAPYRFENGYKSGFRMNADDISIYFETLNGLKEKYKDKIEIFIGFETEYYPKLFDSLLKSLENYKYDYLILGQHFTDNEYDGVYSGDPTNDESVLEKYIFQVIEGIKTGKFTYIAHPDLINFVDRKSTVYKKSAEKLCLAAKDFGVPLEFNFHGIRIKNKYPCREFFKIASEIKNDIVLGIDAHESDEITDVSTEKEAIKILNELNITPINNKNALNYIK